MMESLQNLFQTLVKMKWSDYLDIVVVAFIIYKLLPLLRTPHIMRITRTVVGLLVLAWLTDEVGMYTVAWILNQILAVGIIAFVILYQPELRRMLDHLGSVKFGRFFMAAKPIQETETVILQTVMACEAMSRERVGALIVFSREQNLDEYYKTGTVIDAQVSEQLLRNIFFPKASLHDGAVIIREDRVAAAGCVLPLSNSHLISADLGTRHRAGIGMSEASDAVVVIVSEETGTISVAIGGMLKRHLAPQTLEKLLRKELMPEQEEKPKKLLGKLKKGADKNENK